jgi:hypothetical protein
MNRQLIEEYFGCKQVPLSCGHEYIQKAGRYESRPQNSEVEKMPVFEARNVSAATGGPLDGLVRERICDGSN